MNWYDCPEDDNVYAEIKKRVLAEQNGAPYTMSLVSGDYECFAQAWNQGIDAHLEALTDLSTVTVNSSTGRADITIHPRELPVLIRRLFEDGGEGSFSLATDILSTLDMETI